MESARKPILMLVVHQAERLEHMLTLFRSREPMVDVVGVDTSAKALELTTHHPINAVAVDDHIGDMTGAELAGMVKKVRPEVMAMVMVAPTDARLHPASHGVAGVQAVEKCADLDVLVSNVASRLFKEEVGFRGLIESLELPDILQLLCLRGESKQVRISSDRSSGIVVIENGQVVHARTQSAQGEEAFYDLFAWRGGSFQIQPLASVARRTITKPWESLLLEAGQRLDEGQEETSPFATTTLTRQEELPAPPAPAQAAASPAEVPFELNTAPPGGAFAWRMDTGDASPAADMPGVVVVGTRTATAQPPAPVATPMPTARPKEREPGPLPRELPKRDTPARTPAPVPARAPLVLGRSVPPAPRPLGLHTRSHRKRGRHHAPRWRRAAAWLFITVTASPVLVLVVLALPWLGQPTEMQVHLKSMLPGARGSLPVARNASPVPVAAMPSPLPGDWAGQPGVCRVRESTLPEFNVSGNSVVLSADTFDALGLAGRPWVEILSPYGVSIGARAVRREGESRVVHLRKTMAWALRLDGLQTAYVKVRPVSLRHAADAADELAFTSNRRLAEAYAESWYAAGVSLSTMEEARLTPGSYALVSGPDGFQSVQVQVMDRGNPEEIWLSERVRRAIGAVTGYEPVTLYPRDAPGPWSEASAAARSLP